MSLEVPPATAGSGKYSRATACEGVGVEGVVVGVGVGVVGVFVGVVGVGVGVVV